MLKFIFWTLILANGGLLAYQQGYLKTFFPDGREPARMTSQIKPNSVKLLPASTLVAAPAPVEAPKPEPVACTEIGNFEAADATRFEQRLASLSLGERLVKRTVQEPARSMVVIPPQGSKEGADKKSGELKRMGVTDFFVIQEGAQKWGISLGIFRTEEAARTHLAELGRKGVQTAKVTQFTPPSSKTAYQFRGLDAAASSAIVKIKADFSKQEARSCEAG